MPKTVFRALALLLLPAVAIYGLRGEGLLGNLVEGARLWAVLRPALAGREAVEPRIWRT